MKVHYTYEEFVFACKDKNNDGKANVIKIISIDGDEATYTTNNQEGTFTQQIGTLVNGACHEYGIVENPEILKDWAGFAQTSTED